MCPPSETPNGGYAWIVDLEEFDELPQCPSELLDLTREPGRQKSGNAKSGQSLSAVADAGVFTLETPPGVGEGLRNGMLVVLVGKWLADHPEAEWGDLEPLVVAWNDRCNPPKPAALALKPAHHIWRKEQNAPKLKLDNLPAGLPPNQSVAKPATETKTKPAQNQKMKLMVRQADEVELRQVQWLWPDHIQLGGVNCIAGSEGTGKSILVCSIASCTTTGRSFPDGTYPPKGRVLYCSAEEDASSTVVPRLIAAGADLKLVDIVDGLGMDGESPEDARAIDLAKHAPEVYERLKTRDDYRLVIWDTFQSVSLNSDHTRNTGQKQIIQPLANMAREFAVAMVCVEHYARGGLGKGKPDNAILGGGLVRTSRANWHVIEDPEDETVRMFLHGKINNADTSKGGLNWRFGIDETAVQIGGRDVMVPFVKWEGPSDKTIHQVRDEVIGDGNGPGRPNDKYEAAESFLRAHLSVPMKTKDLQEMTELEPFSMPTLKRAAANIGVQKQKPASGPEAAQAVSETTGISLEDLPTFDGKTWWWFPPPKLKPVETRLND